MAEVDKDGHVFLQWYEYSLKQLPRQLKEWLPKEHTRKWSIEHTKSYGRYVVAKEDIEEGEVLFIDHPIATGPRETSELICLGCYTALDPEEFYRCSKCSWPVCSPECELKGSHPIECKVFTSTGYSPMNESFQLDEDITIFSTILPLRILHLQQYDQMKWNTSQALESHDQQRRLNKDSWNEEQVNIVDFLREKCNITGPDDLLHKIVGIMDTNCHEIRSTIPETNLEYRVRGLYPLTSMMNHACICNTHYTIVEDMNMLVVAAKSIKKGEEITAMYTQKLSPTNVRRKHLKNSKFFDCVCERCKDPTEMGTYFNALQCAQPNCNGNVISKNPLAQNNDSDFECNKCKFELKSHLVTRLNKMVQMDLDNANQSDPIEFEKIFNKYRKALHSNHYHMISIKHILSQTYGRVENYLMEGLTEEQMMRKYNCCSDLISVINVIDPGISRLRGLTYYEMHAPVLIQANTLFKMGMLTKEKYLTKLREAYDYLKKSIFNLQFEPSSTFEGEICKISRNNAADLSNWILTVETLPSSNFLLEDDIEDNEEDETAAINRALDSLGIF